MHDRKLSIFNDISFNPYPIEEYVPMEPLDPAVFDRFCEDGWCYWSDLLFRRNYLTWRGHDCRVILVRIRLKDFTFSKSQRKCLRKNSDLLTQFRSLKIAHEHVHLFQQHSKRFGHNQPHRIDGFFSRYSDIMPCFGYEFDVFTQEREHIASSFFHIGNKSMAGNYGLFSQAHAARSLGTFTMLLEILHAMHLGLEYYYPGFVYDISSEFDYKLNFNNLEYFDWWGNWYPLERLPVRDWRANWEIPFPEEPLFVEDPSLILPKADLPT